MQEITTNHDISVGGMAYQAEMGISHSSDPSDVSMSDVSDDEHGPSDEEDDSMSVDQEDSVSEDEDDGVSDDGVSDDGVSDDEDDEGSDEEEDGVSEGEDDRLPHEKCGLSDYEYVTLSRDQNFGLLEKSAELQDEEADAILDEEAAEAAWPTCCIYLTDATTRLGPTQQLLIAEHSAQYHSPTGHATKEEIEAFHAAKCIEVRAKYCRLIFQHMRRRRLSGPLPIEVRKMIYGYIFEDSYVDLDKDAEREHPSPFSCSHLLQFKIFTADAAVREELAEAWYRASVFWSTDPWNMASSLYQIGWSAGLKPADSLRNGLWPFHEIRNVVVTIPVQFGSDVAKETLVLGKLHCLSLLKKSTTFWFILEGPGNFACLEKDHSDAENYAKSIWYLSSEVRRLRRDGFKVFVTPDWSRTVLFGMEETTVEELTEKVQQAIEESSTY